VAEGVEAVFGVLGDRQGAVCVLQGMWARAWRAATMVMAKTRATTGATCASSRSGSKPGVGRGSGAFGHDHVGEEAQRAGQLVQGVGAGGVGADWADRLSLLYDPQTSGGLLISASAAYADEIAGALERANVLAAAIGRVRPKSGGVLIEIMV